MLAEEEITPAISAYRMLLENLYIDVLPTSSTNISSGQVSRFISIGVCS